LPQYAGIANCKASKGTPDAVTAKKTLRDPRNQMCVLSSLAQEISGI
jgi:hypothetical protein